MTNPVVSVEDVIQIGPSTRVVDVRAPHLYLQSHIASAVNLPEFFLNGPGGPPEPASMAALLGKIGISRDSSVVAYDDGLGSGAARFFWVLTYMGHPKVAVLEGGWRAWLASGGPVGTGPQEVAGVEYPASSPRDEVLSTLPAMKEAVGNSETVIVDARSQAEFLGWQMTARRNGHMPGAVNVDWVHNFRQDEDGIIRLRTEEELRELYQRVGVTPDKHVIVHCQSGNRASSTYLVLKKLGYPSVSHYSLGWSEWGNRDDTPVEDE